MSTRTGQDQVKERRRQLHACGPSLSIQQLDLHAVQVSGPQKPGGRPSGDYREPSQRNSGQWLGQIQNDLFDIGAALAIPAGTPFRLYITEAQVTWLKEICDEVNASVPLPGLAGFDTRDPGGGRPQTDPHAVARSARADGPALLRATATATSGGGESSRSDVGTIPRAPTPEGTSDFGNRARAHIEL